MRVQPEIKMADVKPETLKPNIGDEIYVKFQRNPHIFCVKQHIVGRMLVQDDVTHVRVGGKLKMAACYRK